MESTLPSICPFCFEVIMEGTFLFLSILSIINYYISNFQFNIVTVASQHVVGLIFGYAFYQVIQQIKHYYLNIDVSYIYLKLDKNNRY